MILLRLIFLKIFSWLKNSKKWCNRAKLKQKSFVVSDWKYSKFDFHPIRFRISHATPFLFFTPFPPSRSSCVVKFAIKSNSMNHYYRILKRNWEHCLSTFTSFYQLNIIEIPNISEILTVLRSITLHRSWRKIVPCFRNKSHTIREEIVITQTMTKARIVWILWSQ